jgi:hypothetical protein
MAEKRKKRKPRAGKRQSTAPAASTSSSAEHSGGLLQSMRSGFRRAAGVEEGPKKEESLVSKIIWGAIFVAILAFAAWRWLGLGNEESADAEPETQAEEARTPAKAPEEPVRRTPVKTTHEAPPAEPPAAE